MQTIILASKSPRRKELLRQLGLSVVVLASNAHTLYAFQGDEEQLPTETPDRYVVRTALQKYQEGCMRAQERGLLGLYPVVAADTVVVSDGQVLGKPRDVQEATAFLRRLSGMTHCVMTVVAVGTHPENVRYLCNRTEVTFAKLTREEIADYVRSREPYDKAGGYGIQGLAGVFISSIRGSFTGVMGLPIFRTAQLLRDVGVNPLK